MKVALLDPGGFTPAYDGALASALAAAGHQVTVVSTATGVTAVTPPVAPLAAFPDSVRAPRGTLRHRLALVAKGLRYVRALGTVDTILRDLRPDVIHWQWLPLPLADRRRVAAWSTLAPQVLTVHDATLFNGTGSSAIQSLGYAATVAAMDRMIVHSAHGRAQLLAGGRLDPDRVDVVPHGAFAHYAELAAAAPATEAHTLVVPGTIKPYKGIPILLEAFARIPEATRRGWVVRVVGHPAMDVAPLVAQRQALGLETAVTFEFRRLEEAEFAAAVAQAGMIVLPYTEIDQSGVLMTALALGRPIVASSVGAFPETLEDGTSGLLVPPRDPAALAQALASLMASPARREALGAAAQARAASHFAWSVIAGQTGAVYAAAGLSRRAGAA